MTAVAQIQFGRIPFCVVDSGVVAAMQRAELRVYLVIAGHVNRHRWEARVSVERIAKLSGLHIRSVQYAIRSLKDRGLVRVIAGGGRCLTNRYDLTCESGGLGGPQTLASGGQGFSAGNPGVGAQTLASGGQGFSTGNPGVGAQKPWRGRAETLASEGHPYRENRKNRTRAGAGSRGSPLRPLASGGSRLRCVGGRPSGPSRVERYTTDMLHAQRAEDRKIRAAGPLDPQELAQMAADAGFELERST